MASRLKNIVPFAGLVVGVPTSIAHLLNQEGRGALIPDVATPSIGGLTITADATLVTVTRPGAGDPAAVDVLVEAWDTPEREFGFPNAAPFSPVPTGPQPIVINQGSAAVAVAPTDWKESVRVASTANINLGVGTLLTIDGVGPLVAGDRVLVKNQTVATENGIYTAAVGAWTRAADADTDAEVTPGLATFIEEGTTQKGSAWQLTTPAPVTLGVTSLTFSPNLSAPQFAITAVQVGAFTAEPGQIVRCDPSGGAFTVTLPAITLQNQGSTIVVKNTTASVVPITIATTGGDTIDGTTTIAQTDPFGTTVFVSDGVSNWNPIAVPYTGLKTDWKNSVRVASLANIAVGAGGLLTIDGVGPLVAGDRVLVKNQTLPAENGIYAVAAGAWVRTSDADTSSLVTSGLATFVEEGTTQIGSSWQLTTAAPITLGATALTFSPNLSAPQFSITAVRTSAFTAEPGQIVRCDPSGGTFTVTLPAIATTNQGDTIVIKNTTTSLVPITIATTGGDTVDGTATIAQTDPFGTTVFVSDGVSNWNPIAVPYTGLKTDWKNSVRVTSTVNIAALTGLLTVDGVVLAAENRVLIKNQTVATENGIYLVKAGAWVRAPDADTGSLVTAGMSVFVDQGDTQKNTAWSLAGPGPFTIGVTAQDFEPVVSSPTYAITAVLTSAFTAEPGQIVRCDPTGGAFIVTLPAITVQNQGGTIVVKNSSASTNVITVDTTGGDTIDGAASTTIAVARGFLTFVSDGVGNWDIVISLTSAPATVVESKGQEWSLATTAAVNSINEVWFGMTFANGLFVAVATTGGVGIFLVMTSSDGITWTGRTAAVGNDWRAVTFAAGLFVAVASTGGGTRVMTSPDGITWTTRTSAADNTWLDIAFGAGLFVAVASSGAGNRVMTSPDGITWTIRVSAADNGWQGIAFGAGVFAAVADTSVGNRVMTSPDGITWTIRTSAADDNWQEVTFANGVFVAVSSGPSTDNRVMTSPDGITWTIRTTPAPSVANTWRGVAFGSGVFAAVGSTGTDNRAMFSQVG